MSLDAIAERLQRGVTHAGFEESLTFDCGEDGQVVIADGQVTRVPADTACTIRITAENLDKLVHERLNPMMAVATGKLRVSGDTAVALKLGQLLK